MKKISVFGDSLVYGIGDPTQGGFVSRLQEKLQNKFEFVNFGVCGETSNDLLQRINFQCKESNPDIIIIFIGANDSQYHHYTKKNLISIKEYKNNLKQIFNICKKYTSEIVFIGLPKMNDSITTNWEYLYNFSNENLIKYNKEIKNVCKKNNLKYIPIFDLLEKQNLFDGAHPNEKGYQKITNKLVKFFNA